MPVLHGAKAHNSRIKDAEGIFNDMRKLWIALVHGRHSNKTEDVQTSSVSTETHGGNPAPGYRWKIRPVDSWGDLPVCLERWETGRWREVEREDVRRGKDYAVEVPRVQHRMWAKEQTKRKLQDRNDAYLRSIS